MHVLFGHAVSVNDLHRQFATPGRRANDRADPAALSAWLTDHRERLAAEAEARMVELEIAWQEFTAAAANAAGQIRTASRAERRGDS